MPINLELGKMGIGLNDIERNLGSEVLLCFSCCRPHRATSMLESKLVESLWYKGTKT
jgi:hypothetical protein